MGPNKNDIDSSSHEKLDLILSTVVKLSKDISNLDQRISRLEENLGQETGGKPESSESKDKISRSSKEIDFDDLDEHLKRTYQILAEANEPMTASEVAERMGRSRSTTSYHLNQLEKLDFLEKFSGKTKDNSRSMFFRTK